MSAVLLSSALKPTAPKSAFEEGFAAFQQASSALTGASIAESFVIDHLNEVESAVDELFRDVSETAKRYQNNPTPSLGGYLAEDLHGGTLRISGAGKKIPVDVQKSHGKASFDIKVGNRAEYSLKFTKDAETSIKEQLKIRDDSNELYYKNQFRLIPSDQLKWLNDKDNQERVAQLFKEHPEVKKLFTDHVEFKSDKSMSTSLDDAHSLAEIAAGRAKAGGQTSLEDLQDTELYDKLTEFIEEQRKLDIGEVLSDSIQAGLSAALMQVLIKTSPEIVKAISQLIQNGELNEGQFKSIGFAALEGGAQGFIRGFISSAVMAMADSGVLGETLKKITPGQVSFIVVSVMNAAENSYNLATGKISKAEFVDTTLRQMFIMAGAMGVGSLAQSIIQVPLLGYTIGSFIGSIAATFAYDAGKSLFISLCVENGYTFFGVVDQDYRLPDTMLRQLGLDIIEFETVEYEKVEYQSIEPEILTIDWYTPVEIGIPTVRRGVLEVGRVGYL